MLSYIDTAYLETYATAVSGRVGVRVKWGDPNCVPHTDGRTLVVPKLTSDATVEDVWTLKYALKHEVSHITHTKFAYWQKAGCIGALMLIVNLLEDNRIDYLNDMEWNGDKFIANEYFSIFASRVISMEGKISKQMQALAPVFAWDADHRNWIATAPLAKRAIENKGLSSSEYLPRYSALSAGNYGERLLSLRTMADPEDELLRLAEDILRDIYKQEPENYKEKSKKKGADKGKKGEEGSEEEVVAEDGGEGGAKGDKEGTAPAGDDVDRLIEVDELIKSTGEHMVSRTGVKGKAKKSKKAYEIPTKSDYHIGRFPLSDEEYIRVTGKPDSGVSYYDAHRVAEFITNEARPIANKLRIKLQVKSQGRWEGNKKRGSLHSAGVHKLISAKGTAAADKVFKRHVINDTLDTAVCLLVDCSGSMSGSKFEMATAGAAAVSAALRPLHIEHQVVGFTNNRREDDPIIWVFKDYWQTVSDEDMVARFKKVASALMENTDGDAIAWAAHHLQQRPKHRKLLIVLSDGYPAGRGHKGDIEDYTRDVIKSIERKKEVEIYGVGLQSSAVTDFYTHHTVVSDIKELSPSILSILSKHI